MNWKSKILPELKRLKIAPLMGGQDLNIENPPFEEADYRVCLVFMGDFFAKMVSASMNQLYNLVKSAEAITGKRIYVDFAYQLDTEDVDVMRELGVPEILGWSSFRTLDEFDLLLPSFSIHYEIMSAYIVWRGAGFPPFFNMRIDREELPLVVGGGNVACQMEPLMGPVAEDKDMGPLLDLLYFGEGEDCLPRLVADLMRMKKAGATKMDMIKKTQTEYKNVYFPAGFDHVYDGIVLKEVKKHPGREWANDKVEFNRCFKHAQPMFERKPLIATNGDVTNADLQISHGCSSGCCYFCNEGSQSGVWREYPLTDIVKAFDVLKEHTAPNCVSFFSFNTNYHSEILDLYKELGAHFSKISVIALRADVVAAQPHYVKLLKTLGAQGMTVALEGVSTRIRDNYLNKNLSWEQFLQCADYAFKERMARFKSNMIFSGHETEEDLLEFCSYLEKLVEMRTSYGVRTSLLFSFTTLVYYNGTGMEWTPRRSAVAEIYRDGRLRTVVNKCKELGVGIKFNSGMEFVLQQLLVDGGRRITRVILPLYEEAFKENKNVTSGQFEARVVRAILDDLGLKTREDVEGFFCRPRTFEEPTPWSVYNVIPVDLRREWFKRAGNSPMKYCLKTPANLKPKCYTCGFCPDDEYKVKKVLTRNLETDTKIEDIIRVNFENKARSALRVILKFKTDTVSRSRSKVVHSHYVAARVLRADKRLRDAFHSVANHADYYCVRSDEPEYYGGFSYFDVNLRLRPEELREISLSDLQSAVGAMVSSSEIVAIYQVPYHGNSLKDTEHVWRFETDVTKRGLMERLAGYAGKIRVMADVGVSGSKYEWEDYPTSRFGMYAVQQPLETVGFFTLNERHNPFLALSSFFKMTVKDACEKFAVDRTDAITPLKIPCACGKLTGFHVLLNKMSPVCPICLARGRAARLT